MNESVPENISDLVPPAAEPAQVDDAKVRRKSMADGAWRGLKRGLMWGGIGGLGMTGIGTAIALVFGKAAVGGAVAGGTALAASAPGWLLGLAKVPVIGLPLALGIGAALTLVGVSAVTNASVSGVASAFGGMAFEGMKAYALFAAIPIGAGLLAGAAIGAAWGAISGYMESDTKVEQEHRKAAQVAAQLNFERQRVMKEILQEREMEHKFDQQTKQLYAGNSPEIGNFRSPNTPAQELQDKGKNPNPNRWG